jgi:hypothetical protein
MDTKILDLIKTIWEESPGQTLLELICSCFEFGDISHISDEELKKNLVVLLELDRERKERIAEPKRKRLELVTRVIDGDTKHKKSQSAIRIK